MCPIDVLEATGQQELTWVTWAFGGGMAGPILPEPPPVKAAYAPYVEAQHPRYPKGHPLAGQWVEKPLSEQLAGRGARRPSRRAQVQSVAEKLEAERLHALELREKYMLPVDEREFREMDFEKFASQMRVLSVSNADAVALTRHKTYFPREGQGFEPETFDVGGQPVWNFVDHDVAAQANQFWEGYNALIASKLTEYEVLDKEVQRLGKDEAAAERMLRRSLESNDSDGVVALHQRAYDDASERSSQARIKANQAAASLKYTREQARSAWMMKLREMSLATANNPTVSDNFRVDFKATPQAQQHQGFGALHRDVSIGLQDVQLTMNDYANRMLPPIPVEVERGDYRAYANGYGMTLFVDNYEPRIFYHELGHCLEDGNRNIKTYSDAFRRYRGGGEPILPINDLRKHRTLEPNEMGQKDRWPDAYSSKLYGGGPNANLAAHWNYYDTASTEVFSMGMEQMYVDPATFWNRDREHFIYTATIITGRHQRKDSENQIAPMYRDRPFEIEDEFFKKTGKPFGAP